MLLVVPSPADDDKHHTDKTQQQQTLHTSESGECTVVVASAESIVSLDLKGWHVSSMMSAKGARQSLVSKNLSWRPLRVPGHCLHRWEATHPCITAAAIPHIAVASARPSDLVLTSPTAGDTVCVSALRPCSTFPKEPPK